MFLVLGAALATAGPAAALDDPTRPDVRVTHGPSCKPGGLVVQVVTGTAPYAVRLSTTRTPSGEDEAQLQPGETVVLRSGDVAWGETIDGRLEFTAADGSGYADELVEYSFTRPTREDCAAVARPTTPEPVPAEDPEPPTRVSPGGTVTLEAAGFLPGERVTIQLHAGGDVLGTATAGPGGQVEAEIRIPEGAAAGRTTVDLVGAQSAGVADVELQVAGAQSVLATDGWTELLPLSAAALALVGSVSGLVSVAGGRRAARRHAAFGSA